MPKTIDEQKIQEQVKRALDLMEAHGKMIASKIAVALSEKDMSKDDIDNLYESEMIKIREYWLKQNAPETFMTEMEETVSNAFINESLNLFEMLGGEIGHA